MPRMTTRRWMVVVVIAAVTLYVGIEGRRIGRLRSRRAAALRQYQAAMRWFEEGKVNLDRGVTASQNLMDAQLALSANNQGRIAALSAHLKRAQLMIESLKDEPPALHVDYDVDIRKAEFALEQWREALIKIVAPSVHARLAEEAKTDEGRAIARVRRLGGVVIRDESRPGRPVIEIGMHDLGTDDEDVFSLKPLTSLRRLNVGASGVTDAGLATLEGLTDLEELDVSFSAITRAGLLRLKGLPHLHGLDLASTGVDDSELVIVGELVRIEKLDLDFNRITGVGLASLQGLTKLKDLDLSGNPITDAGLASLRGWARPADC